MGIVSKTLFILLCFASLSASNAASERIKLQFPSHKPAEVSFVTEVKSEGKVAGNVFDFKSLEEIAFLLEVDSPSEAAVNLPLSFFYELRYYKMDLKAPHKKVSTDSRHPETFTRLTDLHAMQGKRFKLTLNEGFQIEKEEQLLLDLKGIHKQLLNPLREPFYLAGHPLKVGAVIEFEFEEPLKSTLKYQITEIGEKEIKALVSFEVARQKLDNDFYLVASGLLKGQIAWQRMNALLFEIDLQGTFLSNFKKGAVEESVSLAIHHHGQSY